MLVNMVNITFTKHHYIISSLYYIGCGCGSAAVVLLSHVLFLLKKITFPYSVVYVFAGGSLCVGCE